MDTKVGSPVAGADRTNHRKVHVAQSPTKRYKIGIKGHWYNSETVFSYYEKLLKFCVPALPICQHDRIKHAMPDAYNAVEHSNCLDHTLHNPPGIIRRTSNIRSIVFAQNPTSKPEPKPEPRPYCSTNVQPAPQHDPRTQSKAWDGVVGEITEVPSILGMRITTGKRITWLFMRFGRFRAQKTTKWTQILETYCRYIVVCLIKCRRAKVCSYLNNAGGYISYQLVGLALRYVNISGLSGFSLARTLVPT